MSGNWQFVCFILGSLILIRLCTQKRTKYPPGPKPLPILGNLRDIVFEYEYEVYAQWGKKFGDLIHLQVLGQHLLYLNSAEAAHDLFEKKSSIYSGRFITPMMKLMGLDDWPLVIMDYGSLWKKHRKIFHQRFEPRAAAEFHDLHTSSTITLLQSLTETPEDFAKHFRHLAGSNLIQSTYGIKVDKNHTLLALAEEAIQMFSDISKPGAYLVDIFPWLQYWPGWAPGGRFKAQAMSWKAMLKRLRDTPWAMVKQRLNAGEHFNCFATTMLQRTIEGDTPATEYDFKGAAATTYGAGTDTMSSCMETFTLAMMLYPAFQQRAQAELDAVIGGMRLPKLSDRPSLPFCEAFFKETLRWSPPVPLGVPHLLTEDDVYRGYTNLKGTIVFPNVWAILHNDRIFTQPERFDPNRYIENPELPDPRVNGVFGWGRRICPGRHMADSLLWLTMVRMLSYFSISGVELGKTEQRQIFESGFTRHPKPFKCLFSPREPRRDLGEEHTYLMEAP